MNSALRFLLPLVFPLLASAGTQVPTYQDFNAHPHNYKTSAPKDRFTQLMHTLETDPRLDRSSEKAFLASFLKILNVPASSQLLVFSTTSLQLRFISPSNPRALYFNEDIYIGYIPGGRIEIIGIDPTLGAIFYIFDIPGREEPMRFERSDRCMNCHAGEDTGYVPGLVVKSVIPGPTGGSLDAFRVARSGHEIPLADRFGGWHVTGKFDLTNHWGNLIGRYVAGNIQTTQNAPGTKFEFSKYLVNTSDILAHLLHEHQAGFINRAVEAGYRVRTAEFLSEGKFTAQQLSEFDDQARILTRYMLFADEAALPNGGIEPDSAFKSDFLATRKTSPEGKSLKDFDLQTRIFKHRCSYMIHSAAFEGLPEIMKQRVFARLKKALTSAGADMEFAYLGPDEKKSIRNILKATVKELPASW